MLRANQALRTYLEGNKSPSHELVLTCNVISCAIESMLGRETDVNILLENGLKMFKSWQKERKQTGAKSNEMYESLEAAFARLDLSATIADHSRMPLFEYDDGFNPSSHDECVHHMSITDANDAHHKLLRIATPAWAFIVRNQEWRLEPARCVPPRIIEEQLLHQRRYSAWSTAMGMFECDRQSQPDFPVTESDRCAEAFSLLATRIHHWCAKRMLEESIPRDDDVCIWDLNPLKAFRYAKAIVAYMDEIRRISGNLGHTSFGPELGIEEGARDLRGAFESWLQLPHPRPTFTIMLGEAGHRR